MFQVPFQGTDEEIAAATKLQAIQRGRAARADVSRLKHDRDAAARAVPPPLDPMQRQVVEKLAEFRARNGEAFVNVVRSKQSGNPLYAFLDAGREDDPVAKYYLQCVEARGSGPAETAAGPSSRVLTPPPSNPTGTNAGVASFVSNDDFPAGLIPSHARAPNAAPGGGQRAAARRRG